METTRRNFVFSGAFAAAAFAAPVQSQTIRIRPAAAPSFRRRLAERELLRGISTLLPRADVRLSSETSGGLSFELRLEPRPEPEAYSIAAAAGQVILSGSTEQALLYAVFDFLERQGVFFGIDGPSYPLDLPASLALPPAGQPLEAKPRFATRGLLPWPDFLNCITVYNEEDFRAYFEAMLRMRFNTFGMHVYTGANQWAESYLSFEFAGAGHLAFLDTSASNRWGYLPERTSRFTMGGSQFFDSEVFGSDSTRLARDPWEMAERARTLLRNGFAHAERLGIRTGIGFEPYQVPDEILHGLPPEAKPAKAGAGPRFDIESVTARDLLEARLAQLLEAYPEVDYVWLWEDENMNWESRKSGQPFSVTPFLQAHDFLRRHAPKKRLVLGGWGGVARHFADFHKRLPGDVIFTCLGDSLGWDPVHEVFGQLEGRERWPIPWLEDDPGMWLTQLHAHRFERDLNRAAEFGCQGLLGIHWRHRIVDPTAGFQARFSWDAKLDPARYYSAYARTQGSGDRASKLASILDDADRGRKLLSTGTDQVTNGHVTTREYSGDYTEGFTFWNTYEPEPSVVASQKEVAAALRALADAARLGYLSGHIDFMTAYTEAWTLAHRLNAVLTAAAELKKAGDANAAREKVLSEGVPLWIKMAPEVRSAMLSFQRIVATRNDLGTLASLHNKFVRLSLVRLRLSMKEYLGELPPEVEALYRDVTAPDTAMPPRLIVPTRPTLLGKGERVRLIVIAAGGDPVSRVTLHTRPREAANWTAGPARLLGRRTYEATLGPFDIAPATVEYRFSAGDRQTPVYELTLA